MQRSYVLRKNRNLSLRELRSFCVAAEYESFRIAAERLFITPSAISHQIKNLEKMLGDKLFSRGNRGLSLTSKGQSLFADVRPLIIELDSAFDKHATSKPRSKLRISVQPFFASEMFVPKLACFRDDHTDIDISVDTSDESSEKHPSDADVSIRVFRSPPANLCCEKLFSLRLAPAGSPELYDSIRVVGNRIVSELPLLIHESRPAAWQEWERASGVRLPKVQKTITLDSMFAIARAAERGLGAALMPVRPDNRWFSESSLVHLFEYQFNTEYAYYFVTKNADYGETIGVLKEWVLQEFGD